MDMFTLFPVFSFSSEVLGVDLPAFLLLAYKHTEPGSVPLADVRVATRGDNLLFITSFFSIFKHPIQLVAATLLVTQAIRSVVSTELILYRSQGRSLNSNRKEKQRKTKKESRVYLIELIFG